MIRERSAAIVTIKDAPKMTKRGRRAIAGWLRKHATWLEEDGHRYATRFTGRYIYKAGLGLG